MFDIVGKYCEGRGLISPVIVPNEESESFWRSEVKKIVERMYPGAFTVAEKVPLFPHAIFHICLPIEVCHEVGSL